MDLNIGSRQANPATLAEVSALVNNKADPTCVDASGYTAREWAERYGHTAAVESLENAEMNFDPPPGFEDLGALIEQQRIDEVSLRLRVLLQTEEMDVLEYEIQSWMQMQYRIQCWIQYWIHYWILY